ncbi:uncharacterized protein LOC122316863 isoform X2 [Carya illinoinensis]|uniref:Uncharacterized protein n=1 Tax=Carya illinoinensis TaxID=32201 RepID=A0A922JFJ7_CARIL|nr:uncharacterized protein LOC122316863 isoform X2 [Carya illinoinensis]KAG6706731.1 hypothetical protein I3842_07G235800 [Carya illinoinensis]
MKVYSKIRNASFPKSRSVDFSDLDSPLQTPKFISNNSKNQEMAQNQISRTLTHVSFPVQEVHEDGSGEIFGVILSRTCSVSSASSKAVRAEKLQKDSSLERAVRRALSMSRSTSVSEGYRRMHHQCDPLVDDDSSATHARRSKNKRSVHCVHGGVQFVEIFHFSFVRDREHSPVPILLYGSSRFL